MHEKWGISCSPFRNRDANVCFPENAHAGISGCVQKFSFKKKNSFWHFKGFSCGLFSSKSWKIMCNRQWWVSLDELILLKQGSIMFSIYDSINNSIIYHQSLCTSTSDFSNNFEYVLYWYFTMDFKRYTYWIQMWTVALTKRNRINCVYSPSDQPCLWYCKDAKTIPQVRLIATFVEQRNLRPVFPLCSGSPLCLLTLMGHSRCLTTRAIIRNTF